jgi:hypothetical protein
MAKAIRTLTYERRAKRLLSENELSRLEESIAARPEAHPVIPGAGGIRKARWGRLGMGKRGGVRAVYYFVGRVQLVYMLVGIQLDIYAKNEKSDLTPADKRELRRIAKALGGD